MKFSSTLFTIGSIALSTVTALQNIQSSDAQLSIRSPLQNGIYVANKTLPLTYIPAASANLKLNIYLRGTDVSFNETAIAIDADVSNNPVYGVPDPASNTVYYQHSMNYDIPCSTPAGGYEVIFHNANANVNTTIPISILPCAPSSSGILNLSSTLSSAVPTATDSTVDSQPSATDSSTDSQPSVSASFIEVV